MVSQRYNLKGPFLYFMTNSKPCRAKANTNSILRNQIRGCCSGSFIFWSSVYRRGTIPQVLSIKDTVALYMFFNYLSNSPVSIKSLGLEMTNDFSLSGVYDFWNY